MSTRSQRVGRRGEILAAAFLRRRGYHVLHERLRLGHDEIDLVAEKDGVLVFVEVKTAGGQAFGEPETWVTAQKQKRLLRAAAHFLHEHHRDEQTCRFDVVTVRFEGATTRIVHIKDAFHPWDLEDDL